MVDYDVEVDLGEFPYDVNDVSDDEGENNTDNKASLQAGTYPVATTTSTAMVAE